MAVDRDSPEGLPSWVEAKLASLCDLSVDAQESALDELCRAHPEHAERIGRVWQQLAELATQAAPDDAAGSESEELAAGRVLLERYRIVRLIGRGGMGEVYAADDLVLHIPVALKFLPPSMQRSPRRLELFRAEVRLARRVSHPNVCRVHDIGQCDGRVFLSMELVEGDDLASLLDRIGRLPFEKAMEIARQLCAALHALHDQGLVHRDLKPANILLDERGRAKLSDFGLAVTADQSIDAEAAGTPMYMAPEQLRGRTATMRSDIYALGLVLYELFAGVRAHTAWRIEDLARIAEAGTPLRPLSDILDRPAHDLDEVIAACLAPDPIDRPSSALSVLAQLPGGDPLRAVMEADQTPSPELVAAAGRRVHVSRRVAALLLGGALACLPTELLIKEAHSEHRVVPLDKSPAVLVDRAQTMLRRLGYDAPAADHYCTAGFRAQMAVAAMRSQDATARLGERDTDLSLRELLSRRHPGAFRLVYVESPVYLQDPEKITATDSVPDLEPGAVAICVTQSADLLWLRAAAPRRIAATANEVRIDDQQLLAMAGFDPATFRAAAPAFVAPGVASDERSAWLGSYPGLADFPLRIEVARSNGRVVSFEMLRDAPPVAGIGPAKQVQTAAAAISLSEAAYGTTFMLLVVGGLSLAYRQWRAGRGDLRGARRLAGAVFALTMLKWLLASHHVPSMARFATSFERGIGTATQSAVVAFALYLACEPLVRRYAPVLLVSWTRLLAGRWNDQAVGRDVLIGLCFTALYKLSELIWKTDWVDPLRPGSGLAASPSVESMLSLAHAIGATAGDVVSGIVNASLTLLMFVVVVRWSRWRPLGLLLGVLVLAVCVRLQFGAGTGNGANFAAVSFAALAMVLAMRFGLLALVVSFAGAFVLNGMPTTIRPSDWWFPSFAIEAGAIVAVALLAFRSTIRSPGSVASRNR